MRYSNVPQTTKAHPKQVKNTAGGYSFKLDEWGMLRRFLILGSEVGTYYVGRDTLTKLNSNALEKCLAKDGRLTVRQIIEVSDSGAASKNAPAVFALAMASVKGDIETRREAFRALPLVCRTGTDLFQFVDNRESLGGGWGRLMTDSISKWFNRPISLVAYQSAKYKQREGWSMRDLLRLAHPVPASPAHSALFKYVVSGELTDTVPVLIQAMEEAKTASTNRLVNLIRDYNLTREMIPTEALNNPDVWMALLEKMPLRAMVRNLGKMSQVGILGPRSVGQKLVCDKLNQQYIMKSRLHPYALLVALKVYQQGEGMLGDLTWKVNQAIVDKLDDAFYLAFGNVEDSGKSTLVALDVSGSMSAPLVSGYKQGKRGLECVLSPVTCCEAGTAMGLITMSTQKKHIFARFNNGLQTGGLRVGTRMDDALRWTSGVNFGGTDCALPMVEARRNKWEVDTFVIITDNDTWAGNVHPHTALEQYRDAMGIPAKVVVVGMASTGFTIANPDDPGMLDVVGFDTSTPQLISEFSK